MGRNGTYHENQLVELYKLVHIPIKTETHTWGPSLVREVCCSTYYAIITGFVDCRIKLCIKWSKFQRERFWKTWEFRPKYCVFDPVLLVCLAEFCSSTSGHHLIGFAWCKIKFYVQRNQLGSNHRSKNKFLLHILGKQRQEHSILIQTRIFFQHEPFDTSTVRCKINACIQQNQLWRHNRSKNKFLLDILTR
jgi:hypothetical protein